MKFYVHRSVNHVGLLDVVQFEKLLDTRGLLPGTTVAVHTASGKRFSLKFDAPAEAAPGVAFKPAATRK